MAGRTDTKREILDVAEQLWLHRGYNGFSYQHIAKQLGIKSAAVHYHYPAKQDLGVALVERMRRRFARWVVRTAELDGFWPKLDAYIAIHQVYLDDDSKVCPTGILDAEFHTISDEMRRSARELTREMHGWLTTLFRDGREKGDVCFRGEPDGVAAVVGATVQGALQIARAVGRGSFHLTIDHLKLQLRRREPTVDA
ncbi:MAG: TetR/AcrR family transcriptional regulator [Deltaproteobacteria bacterium]|nr:MAG: TetR/AcrR family transcriptional regulator [Deltaproteobacteria bacterium]